MQSFKNQENAHCIQLISDWNCYYKGSGCHNAQHGTNMTTEPIEETELLTEYIFTPNRHLKDIGLLGSSYS